MALPFPRDADEESMRQWVEENPGETSSGNASPIHKALIWAVENDYPMLVTYLLEEKGADVNLTDSNCHTPLHAATSAEMITVLLNHGADVAVSEFWYGLTPFMWQIWKERVECVRRLLEDSRVIAGIVRRSQSMASLPCTSHV